MKKSFLIPIILFQLFSAQEIKTINLKSFEKTIISDTLEETSGLVVVNGKLLSMNDSGNSAEIFEFSPDNGNITKTYSTNAVNIDWEAITLDSNNNIYVGDFGNNHGNRKDLSIYKFPFTPDVDSLKYSSKINFFYPQQKDFSKKNVNHDLDCEAMIFLNDKIHIFSKSWKTSSVVHYTIDPDIEEKQPAKMVESYQSDFVVTDATYFQGKLYLIGYTKFSNSGGVESSEVYLLSCEETSQGIFFDGEIKKYLLGKEIVLGQIEGIVATDLGLYISGERFNYKGYDIPPHLYFLPFDKLK